MISLYKSKKINSPDRDLESEYNANLIYVENDSNMGSGSIILCRNNELGIYRLVSNC